MALRTPKDQFSSWSSVGSKPHMQRKQGISHILVSRVALDIRRHQGMLRAKGEHGYRGTSINLAMVTFFVVTRQPFVGDFWQRTAKSLKNNVFIFTKTKEFKGNGWRKTAAVKLLQNLRIHNVPEMTLF